MKAWRRTEERAAEALGGRRHQMGNRCPTPDVTVVVGDDRLVVECKTRGRVPAIVRQALDQAAAYCLSGFGQIPVGVIRASKSKVAIAVLDLGDLVKLLRSRSSENARSSRPDLTPSPEPVRAVAPPDTRAYRAPDAIRRATPGARRTT